MRRNQYRYGPAMVALAAIAWTNPAAAIDLDALEAKGEVYVVALYAGYQSEANELAAEGRDAVAEYLRGRARAIEAGAELFPNHPVAFPALGESEERVLIAAHKETFALVGSEAAEVAPDKIAAVQVAYEKWLFSSAEEPDALFVADRAEWNFALDRFVSWSQGLEGPALSADISTNLVRVSAAQSW